MNKEELSALEAEWKSQCVDGGDGTRDSWHDSRADDVIRALIAEVRRLKAQNKALDPGVMEKATNF